jgi:uncharacterized protein
VEVKRESVSRQLCQRFGWWRVLKWVEVHCSVSLGKVIIMKAIFIRFASQLMAVLALVFSASAAHAQNLEANTPAVTALKKSMADRHGQLAPHYGSGAVGIATDGSVVVRDANAIPLAQRGAISGLVNAENTDRAALYKELARANGKPEWEGEIRNTFAQRWIANAQAGWMVQTAQGQWVKK